MHVSRKNLVALAALVALTACSGVAGPGLDLKGSWGWEYNLNPAGSDMSFSLAAFGGKVTGAGISHGIGPARTPDSLTVAGSQLGTVPFVRFHLTITFARGTVVTYVGQLVGANELEGTWTTATESHTVRFYRQESPFRAT